MPVLYSVGRYNVYSFGIFLAISFILSTFIVFQYAKEEFKEEEYLDTYFYTTLVTLVFARAIYIIRNFNEFGFIILKYFLVVETPGLSLLGGSLGGFIFLYIYCRRKKLNFVHLLDIFSVAGALALVFIKIGQQLGGAAFGRETNSFFKIRIIGRPGFYYPVEFYEAAAYFILFLVLLFLYRKKVRRKWKEGIVFAVFSIVLSIITFALEFLKVNRVYLYSLSFRQILSVIIFVGFLSYLLERLDALKYFKKNKHDLSQKAT